MILAALGMVSTSVMAGTDTIKSIWVKSDRTVIRLNNDEACRVDTTQDADFVKRFVAAAMTAQAQGRTVILNYSGALCTDMIIK